MLSDGNMAKPNDERKKKKKVEKDKTLSILLLRGPYISEYADLAVGSLNLMNQLQQQRRIEASAQVHRNRHIGSETQPNAFL